MGALWVTPIFLVLLASFAISLRCSWSNRASKIGAYLFSGNTPMLAFSSCIGSIMSMAISFTALISSGYMFGWQIIFSLVAGSVTGLVAILCLLKSRSIAQLKEISSANQDSSGVSYLVTFQRGRSLFPAFFILYLVFYSALLATELSVLRVFLGFLLHIPTPELFLILLMIVFVCYGYVFIGGFRAVLVTDYFQLMVVLSFIGLLLANADFSGFHAFPAATAAKIKWTSSSQALLHVGVFLGAFSWSFANIDQWYRTVGTLPIREAREVLIWSTLFLCVMTVVPVIGGSYALTLRGVPLNVTNDISLILVQRVLRDTSLTLRFVFVMALVCAALTTLNTYIMTIQQLYYEFSVRLGAKTHRWYLLEYVTKWKQVRGVGLWFTVICFLISFMVADKAVYGFGVLALSGYVFSVPFLLAEAFNPSGRNRTLAQFSGRATIGLIFSLVIFPFLLLGLRSVAGPISLHLYVITAAAGLATICGSVLSVFVPKVGEIKNAAQ